MNIQVDPTSSNLASAMLNSKIRPRAVEGYGVKIFHPSPPNYVTRKRMYKLVEREAFIDLVRVMGARFQGFYGFPCCLGVGETASCHVLGRVAREVEMVRRLFRSVFLHFFYNVTKILLAFWFKGQGLHHRERVHLKVFTWLSDFRVLLERKLIAVLSPLKDTSGESQNIWLVAGYSLKDDDTNLLLT